MEVHKLKIYYRSKPTTILPTNIQLVRVNNKLVTLKYNIENNVLYINEIVDVNSYLFLFEILNDVKLWDYKIINGDINYNKEFIILFYIVPEYIEQYLNKSLCLNNLLSNIFWKLSTFTNINIENNSFIPLTIDVNPKESFKLVLYNYQKKSLAKMLAIEKNEIENIIEYTYNINFHNIKVIYNPINNKIIDTPKYFKLKTQGGILSDEMGLGKTITSIALIDYNPAPTNLPNFNENNLLNSKATLIICQPHLVKQWETEIKRCNPKLKLLMILTKTSFNNLTFNDFINADIIITNFQFLINKKFYVSLYEFNNGLYANERKKYLLNYYDTKIKIQEYDKIKELTYPMFEFFHFHRFILDEGHEIFGETLDTQITSKYMKIWISDISANNYWYISGTPFTNFNSSINCAKFIRLQLYDNEDNLLSSCIDNNIIYDIIVKDYLWKNILEKICIRHRKVDVENQINIHGFEEKVIWIKFTDLERNFYDAKKGKVSNEYLQQLCCHPLVVESSKKIFGNIEVDLSVMQDKLIDYHKDNYEKYKLKLSKLDTTKPEYHMLKKNYDYQINESKYLFTILEKMKEPDKIDNCSICLDEINKITITACGHLFCYECIKMCLDKKMKCPLCQTDLKDKELLVMNLNKTEPEDLLVNKYGSKLGKLITMISKLITQEETRIIVFSQWDDMLNLVGKTLAENGIANCFVKGNIYSRNAAIRKFKNGITDKGDDNKVIMLSLKNAASGTNLTEATHIFFIEPINNTSEVIKTIESQAIARACRIGQKYKTQLIRILLSDTIEEIIYNNKYK
jgi:SNF2 family DNA or RNA helicase